VPLIEIVSEPDIATPDEAYEYLTRLKEIILYTGVSDAHGGGFRCAATPRQHTSARPEGTGHESRNQKRELVRFIREALVYEIARQVEVVESGGTITQEPASTIRTRVRPQHALERAGARLPLFSRADLLPLVVDEKWKAEIAKTLPELPAARRARLVKEYGITEYDAQVLTVSKSLADHSKRRRRPRRIPSEWRTWCRVN